MAETPATTIGCGLILYGTHADGTPHEIACGTQDDFGVRQLCHVCNVRSFFGRMEGS